MVQIVLNDCAILLNLKIAIRLLVCCFTDFKCNLKSNLQLRILKIFMFVREWRFFLVLEIFLRALGLVKQNQFRDKGRLSQSDHPFQINFGQNLVMIIGF